MRAIMLQCRLKHRKSLFGAVLGTTVHYPFAGPINAPFPVLPAGEWVYLKVSESIHVEFEREEPDMDGFFYLSCIARPKE